MNNCWWFVGRKRGIKSVYSLPKNPKIFKTSGCRLPEIEEIFGKI
jgi:hypothetical protein